MSRLLNQWRSEAGAGAFSAPSHPEPLPEEPDPPSTSPGPPRRSRLPRITGGSRLRWIALLAGLGLLHAIVAVSMALLVRALLEADSAPADVAKAGLGLLALALTAYLAKTLEGLAAEALGQSYVHAVRLVLLRHLQQSAWHPNRRARLGLTLNRLVTDLGSVRNWVSRGVAQSASSVATLLALTSGILIWQRALALPAAAMLGITLLAALSLNRSVRTAIRTARQRRGGLAGFLGDAADRPFLARSLGQSGGDTQRLRQFGARLRHAQIGLATRQALLRFAPDLAHGCAIAIFAVTAVSSASGTKDAASSLGSGLILLTTVTAALRQLTSAWGHRLNYLEGRRRLRSLLRSPRLDPTSHSQRPLNLPIQRLEAKDLESPGLARPFHGVACRGKLVLIQGAEGSGKSVLTRLLARLHDPAAGAITLDGIDLRSVDPHDLPRAVQLVSPDLPLREGTVAENLGCDPSGKPPSDPSLHWARLCGLLEGPHALPSGLATRLAGRGENLSSGQRHRIALARALSVDPSILVIDEPAFVHAPELVTTLSACLSRFEGMVFLVAESNPLQCRNHDAWNLSKLPKGFASETNGPSTE